MTNSAQVPGISVIDVIETERSAKMKSSPQRNI